MIRSHVSTPVSRRTLLKSAAVGLSTIAPVKSFETTRAFSDPAPRVKGFIDQSENETICGLIQKFVEQYSLPGFSLAMTYQGELKLVACHGFAHQEKNVPVTPRHRFRLASVSKPITGATLIRLVEQKQIRLDDRIFGPTGWLKDFYNISDHEDGANRERLGALTLEHLLEHTGGGWGNRRRDPMFAHEALGLDHAKLIPWTIDAIPLERDPGRPDGPLDRAARQYWRWGRAGCHPGAIQAGVENVDSVAVKNRLKKSARIAPVLTAQEGRSGAAVAS